MKPAWKELFKAIHGGYWLAVEYRNRKQEITNYWICVRNLDPLNRRITADGMHIMTHSFMDEAQLYIDSIVSARALEGTYAPVPQELVNDIRENPEKYASVFSDVSNLKILQYLSECHRLDEVPFKTDFALVGSLDDEVLESGTVKLNEAQYVQLLNKFTNEKNRKDSFLQMKQLGMNLLSVHTKKGLYVLAYQPLRLNVRTRELCEADDIVICTEFTINGERQSIRQFLDADEMYLLNNVKQNAETIRDLIASDHPEVIVDDMPYILETGRKSLLNLEQEYDGILQMYHDDTVSEPVRAFFGELTVHSRRKKSFPFALLNREINLDQLLAMNHAMRYPVSYVQGPPGTGKTMTIVNLIITAFFNGRTVLLSSYNNHPLNEAVKKLQSLRYGDGLIPFPVIRLGSNLDTIRSLREMKYLLDQIRNIEVDETVLRDDFKARSEQAKDLTAFLENYEERLELLERRDAAEQLAASSTQMNFSLGLSAEQIPEIDQKLKEIGELKTEDALKLIDTDFEALGKWLYYASIRCLKRIFEPKNSDLFRILSIKDDESMIREFNHYLCVPDNLKRFLRIFPAVVTTCISAHKLGLPEPVFDMTILDEASQCSAAVSLVPVIRGRDLLLVGDPQQLQPVIQLPQSESDRLRNRYGIGEEYDYCRNSIYKTYLAVDAVSDEVLLSHHYRCDPRIISFNNRKYYGNKLKMDKPASADEPLVFIDVPDNESAKKNTAPKEADAIIDFIRRQNTESIGIITPFVNQRQLIQEELRACGMDDVSCGTVHAFQGDEKETIIFSLCLSDRTRYETYQWLKNSRELINVSASRARSKLVLVGSAAQVERLHSFVQEADDLFDLVNYVRTNGTCEITEHPVHSRALGIRPYSTETEEAFLTNLNHALDTAFADGSRYTVHKEVPISQVFMDNITHADYFYRGRFDFVVFRRRSGQELPVLAIELDGREHLDKDIVILRDKKKEAICREHGFDMIRVDNTYARRYHYIKEILIRYFKG